MYSFFRVFRIKLYSISRDAAVERQKLSPLISATAGAKTRAHCVGPLTKAAASLLFQVITEKRRGLRARNL